ncbi:N-(5'-phosphoribosyl)anthranilate isomerase [Candidatus Methanoperedenaceae archaeon GB37]|nr:N-(5'-phosphoribosyl)anthranilate isomerase [Candidatus Methanoperedenaceae archaeon GB37]
MLRVKICGIKNEDELKLALTAGADAVGFITEVPLETPRRITLERARRLVRKVPIFVESVLVIMPTSPEEVYQMAERARPGAIQIHTPPDFELLEKIQDLRRENGIKIVQTIGIGKKTLLEIHGEIERISRYIDAVLLDTERLGGGGGTGRTHDWSMSREIVEETRLPVILAGGLNHENVRDAVRTVRPYGVDTASGVEVNGVKEKYRLRAFIINAKECG